MTHMATESCHTPTQMNQAQLEICQRKRGHIYTTTAPGYVKKRKHKLRQQRLGCIFLWHIRLIQWPYK